MSRRLVVFDLDGTLVDSSHDLADAVNAMLAVLAPNAAALPLSAIRSFVGNGASSLVRRSLDAAGLDLATGDALPRFMEAYEQRLLRHTRLYGGIREALDALSGARLAVLTNKPGAFSRTILAGLGVGDRFEHVWGPDDAGARKPDPEGLRRMLEVTDTPPSDACLVGDSPIDVATARAASLRAVGVTWGFDPARLRDSAPDALVDDPRGLPAVLL